MELSPFPHHGPLDRTCSRRTANSSTISCDGSPNDESRPCSGRDASARPRRCDRSLERCPTPLSPCGSTSTNSRRGPTSRSGSTGRSPAWRGVPSGLFGEIAAGLQLHSGCSASSSATRSATSRCDAHRPRSVRSAGRASATQPVVLIVDEFSGIVGVDGAAAMMRTALQHHFQDIGLLFAGRNRRRCRCCSPTAPSRSTRRPTWSMRRRCRSTSSNEWLHEGFAAPVDVPAGRSARLVVHTRGHPHRTMELADAVWQTGRAGRRGDRGNMRLAVSTPCSPPRRRGWSDCSRRCHGRTVGVALGRARRQHLRSARQVARPVQRRAQHARTVLIDRGHLQRTTTRSRSSIPSSPSGSGARSVDDMARTAERLARVNIVLIVICVVLLAVCVVRGLWFPAAA